MKKTLAALLLVSLGLTAQADSLTLTYTGKSGQVANTNAPTSNFVGGAMYYRDAASKSFEAFCVEPTQSHALDTDGAISYTLGSFSATQARLLQGLFSTSYASLSTGYQRGAFQMAVWEIVSETGSTLDINAGSFKFISLTRSTSAADNAAFAAVVTNFLTAASAYSGPALYDIKRLSNDRFQDLVLAAPVPEPSTYALLLGGLALVAVAKRRKA